MNAPTKEYGQLFKGAMVRQILRGKKLQTRRPVTRDRSLVDGYAWRAKAFETLDFSKAFVDPGPSPAGNPGPYLHVPRILGSGPAPDDTVHRVYSRRWTGDRIWVRETWQQMASYIPDEKEVIQKPREHGGSVLYRADGYDGLKWRSPLLIPRWASRINLQLTGVRVERVQAISDADVAAEGVTVEVVRHMISDKLWESHMRGRELRPIDLWRLGWIQINGAGSWHSNPWCWVYEFKVLRP